MGQSYSSGLLRIMTTPRLLTNFFSNFYFRGHRVYIKDQAYFGWLWPLLSVGAIPTGWATPSRWFSSGGSDFWRFGLFCWVEATRRVEFVQRTGQVRWVGAIPVGRSYSSGLRQFGQLGVFSSNQGFPGESELMQQTGLLRLVWFNAMVLG